MTLGKLCAHGRSTQPAHGNTIFASGTTSLIEDRVSQCCAVGRIASYFWTPRRIRYNNALFVMSDVCRVAFVCLLCSLCIACLSTTLSANSSGQPTGIPSWSPPSRVAEENAISAIPFEKLDNADREKISTLLSGSHIFRRLPAHVGPCNPDLYLFLVRHPDVVVGIWEELQISQLKMRQIGPLTYKTQEKSGTTGTSRFLYRDPNLHLIWVDGVFNGPLLSKPVSGVSLLVLHTVYVREPDGQYYITSRLDTFTHIDNVGIEFITRTLQPLMGHVVDNNFLQTSAFVASLSKTAETNPRGVRRLAGRLDRVHPDIRHEFGRLAYQVANKNTLYDAERLAARPIAQDTLD